MLIHTQRAIMCGPREGEEVQVGELLFVLEQLPDSRPQLAEAETALNCIK